MSKSNTFLMISAVLAALVLVGGGALVVREIAQLQGLKKTLKVQAASITNSCAMNPYPSSGNVDIQNRNVQQLDAKLGDMMSELGKANFTAPEVTAAGFVNRFEKLRQELTKSAQMAGTHVPTAFAFGFDRWADGKTLPDKDHLEVLSRQLAVGGALCRILFEEGCSELSKVTREEVESASSVVAAPAPGEEPKPVVPARFERIRFTLEFVAKEQQLFKILNRMAADPMFLVVSSVGMTKDHPDVAMPAPKSQEVASPDDDERPTATNTVAVDPNIRVMVSGPTVDTGMRLTLVVDAYHFLGVAEREK